MTIKDHLEKYISFRLGLNKISKKVVQNLIASMPRRYIIVIKAKGEHAKHY